jgi:hypothetical protein
LPTADNVIVLCNFNKIDKLDPLSFGVWLDIMRTFPSSVLWLLIPATPHGHLGGATGNADRDQGLHVTANLRRQAAAAGISWSRVIFAPRLSKEAHILRHGAADVFLDTFVYGAHSTATDALRGVSCLFVYYNDLRARLTVLLLFDDAQGLPVVTVHGNSFPSRVGSSLLNSFDGSRFGYDAQILNCDSLKDYASTIHSLLSNLVAKYQPQRPQESASVLQRIKHDLISAATSREGLFDATATVRSFVRASSVMIEVTALSSAGIGIRKVRHRAVQPFKGYTDVRRPNDNGSEIRYSFESIRAPHIWLSNH